MIPKTELGTYSKVLLLVVLQFMTDTTCQRLKGLENLALISKGASCLVGTYNVTFDVNCSNTIDGTHASYTPRPGHGWLTVTLDTAAMVTAVDILLDWRSDMDYDSLVRLRLIFSDGQEFVKYVERHEGDYDIFRQRVLLALPVFSKSVTLSWTADRIPPISDINIIGSTTGISRVTPANVSCIRAAAACDLTVDGNMVSNMYLIQSNQMEVSFSDPVEIGWLAFYAHPLLEENTVSEMKIGLKDEEGDQRGEIILDYRSQGWETEARWQTVMSYGYQAYTLTITAERDYVAISEMEFYHTFENFSLPREAVWLGDLPYFPMQSGGMRIFDSEPWIEGDMPDRPIPTTTSEPLEPSTAEQDLLTTTEEVHTTEDITTETIITTKLPRKLYDSEPLDVSPSFNVSYELYNTNSSESLTSNDTLTVEPAEVLSFWGLAWYWYVSIGIGGFCLILVIIIIVLVSQLRKKHKDYAPNPRPRIVLRSLSSVGGESDAISVVTPTRGCYQLTINSQSSAPNPYVAFSPYNTSTFGRHGRGMDMAMYQNQNGFNFMMDDLNSNKKASVSESMRRSVTDRYGDYGMKIHDGELSDDCFKP